MKHRRNILLVLLLLTPVASYAQKPKGREGPVRPTNRIQDRRSRDLIVLVESCKYDEEKCTGARIGAFIKAGADLNAKSDGGLPVLQLALAYQLSPDVIRLLVGSGADVNGRDNFGKTAVMILAEQTSVQNIGNLEILLKGGADVNARDNNGWTPLMFGAYHGAPIEFTKRLLAASADATLRIPSQVRSYRPEEWKGGDSAADLADKYFQRMKRDGPSTPALQESNNKLLQDAEKVVRLLRNAESGRAGNAGEVGRAVNERPPLSYVKRDVCPGEGCKYGEWIAEKSTPVFAKEGNTSSRVLTLRPDEVFTAIRGNVHITRLGVVLVKSPVSATENSGSRELHLEKGDTIFVLTQYGEGLVDVWHEGEVYQIWAFWSAPGSFLRDAKGVQIESPQSEWWVFIKTRTGSFGWIRR